MNKYFIGIVFCLLLYNTVWGQTETVVKGVVTDAKTNEPLPFTIVAFVGTSIGVTTDFDGAFVLRTNQAVTQVKVTYVGYSTQVKNIEAGKEQVVNFKLSSESVELKEVKIIPTNKRYKNKNNPAVELIDKVIAHKSSNRTESFRYYQNEKYEKIQFAITDITDKFKNKKLLRKFKFVFDNIDTTKIPGQQVLPIFIKEDLSDVYYRKEPETKKEIVKANKQVSFSNYIDDKGVSSYIKYLSPDINIYDNTINLLSNQFVSPISPIAPTFYHFYITDTSIIDGIKCITLAFFPRNKADMLFQGFLYITDDTSYAVRKLEMSVNKDINLNWVNEIKITQEYEKKDNAGWILTKDEFAADFGLFKKGKGLFGQKSVSYNKWQFNVPANEKIYKGESYVVEDSANKKTADYWNQNRHENLTKTEQGIYTTIDSIKKVPAYRHAMTIIFLFVAGFKNFGPFEIGPANTFYSFNPVEGLRLRFGGRTTTSFSKQLALESYVAYGFKDQKYKYYGGVTYALPHSTVYNFPLNTITVSYQDETRIPGQELQFVQEDNILLSFKRGPNSDWLYNKIFNLTWLKEFKNHFSFSIGYQNLIQAPAGSLVFNTDSYFDSPETNVSQIQTSTFSALIRWAPNEKFYQGKSYRIPIVNQYPIFQLRVIAGVKGFLNGEYNYQNVTLNITKRVLISPIGYSDITLEGGKIFGQVPYPLLLIPRANETYSYQLQSYNLMNFLEFVNDQYVAADIEHYFNGFFLNKIPLLKKLRLREVIDAKAIWGDLSQTNNPAYTSGLFKLPVTNYGEPVTGTLAKGPYIEGSVGVANIFKLFRIDLVHRFTYLDNPNVDAWGIRGRFKVDF